MENATNDCSLVVEMWRNSSDVSQLVTQLMVVPIFLVSVVGNTCTIGVMLSFKKQRVPDVLVLGLAITDMVATLIPIPMTIYSYASQMTFPECSALCGLYATVAQFTRYSSALITTVIALERNLAICSPFFYRSRCTPAVFWTLLILCWFVAGTLAVLPWPLQLLSAHIGYCLFDFTTSYANAIIVYGLVQFVVVLVCFVMVTVELIRVKRRRDRMRRVVRKQLFLRNNSDSKPPPSPGLVSRISDLGKSLKTAAPVLSDKLQLGVEAKFLRMFVVVVILFYLSWLPIVVMIIYAQVIRSEEPIEDVIFWGIRLTVISLAINPFIYGLLAGQYRNAYLYILRLAASKCCPCVSPPKRNVFARGSSFEDSFSSLDDANRRTHPHHLASAVMNKAFIHMDTINSDSLEEAAPYSPSINSGDDKNLVPPTISKDVTCNGHTHARSNSLTHTRHTLSPNHKTARPSKHLFTFNGSKFNSLQCLQTKTETGSRSLRDGSSQSHPNLT